MTSLTRTDESATRWWTARWVDVVAWIAAGFVAVVLSAQRYAAAMSQRELDFNGYFLAAARAVLEGRSPYVVDGYYYTPLVAEVLAPFAHWSGAQTAWTLAMLAAAGGTAFFGVLACTPNWRWRHRAWLFVIAIVTLLWSWPVTLEFFLGQVNLFVGFALALSAFLATRGRYLGVGIGLGLAAAIKTWPALFLLWVLRRGGRGRMLTVLGAALWGALMVVLALTSGGPQDVATMVSNPFRGTNQPGVVAYSAWGLGKALFGGLGWVMPVAISPVAQGAVTAVVAAIAVGLLILALRRPGTDVIALYNVVFVVLLMIPISHIYYLLLPLPALWWWIAESARSAKRALNWIVVAVLTGWWVICFRLVGFGWDKRTALAAVVAIVMSTVIAAAASIIGAAMISRQPQPAVGSPGEGTSRADGADLPETRSKSRRSR